MQDLSLRVMNILHGSTWLTTNVEHSATPGTYPFAWSLVEGLRRVFHTVYARDDELCRLCIATQLVSTAASTGLLKIEEVAHP
jgi:hypothetical protein